MSIFIYGLTCLISFPLAPASSNDVQAEPMSTDPPQTTVHPPQNMMGTSPVS